MNYEEDLTQCTTAYHEAGHAVVMYKLGLPFITAYITPDKKTKSAGRIYGFGKLKPNASRDRVEKEIIMIYAGGLATVYMFGDDERHWTGSRDKREVNKLLRSLEPNYRARRRLKYRLRQRSEQMVDEHFNLIDAFATRLLENDWAVDIELKQIDELINCS